MCDFECDVVYYVVCDVVCNVVCNLVMLWGDVAWGCCVVMLWVVVKVVVR